MPSRKFNSLSFPQVPDVKDPVLKKFLEDNQKVFNNTLKLLKTYDEDNLMKRTLVFSFTGNASVLANAAQRLHVNYPGRILNARAYTKTAPTGANLIFDINKDGTSVWNTTPANRLTIAAAENEGTQNVFDFTKFDSGAVFTLDVDQVGSGTAGANITVELEVQIDI